MATAADETLNELAEFLRGKLGGALLSAETAFGELTITVERDQIVQVLKTLRDDARCRFEQLIDLCGVDYPARPNRFDVVYHFVSHKVQ